LSRDLQLNCVISFFFRLHLVLHACAARFDVTDTVNFFGLHGQLNSQEYNTIRRPSMRRLHQCSLRPCMQPFTLLCTCSVVHTVPIDNLVFAKYAWTRAQSSLVVKAKYFTCQLNLSPSLLLLLLLKIIKYNDILLAKTTIP
jgi:hypothetical protein